MFPVTKGFGGSLNRVLSFLNKIYWCLSNKTQVKKYSSLPNYSFSEFLLPNRGAETGRTLEDGYGLPRKNAMSLKAPLGSSSNLMTKKKKKKNKNKKKKQAKNNFKHTIQLVETPPTIHRYYYLAPKTTRKEHPANVYKPFSSHHKSPSPPPQPRAVSFFFALPRFYDGASCWWSRRSIKSRRTERIKSLRSPGGNATKILGWGGLNLLGFLLKCFFSFFVIGGLLDGDFAEILSVICRVLVGIC